MQYRRNTTYRVLSYVCLLIGILLIVLSLGLLTAPRIAFVLIGALVLVIAFSYFRLSTKQNKGSS